MKVKVLKQVNQGLHPGKVWENRIFLSCMGIVNLQKAALKDLTKTERSPVRHSPLAQWTAPYEEQLMTSERRLCVKTPFAYGLVK